MAESTFTCCASSYSVPDCHCAALPRTSTASSCYCKFVEKAFYLTIDDHSGVRKSTDLSGVPKVAHIRVNAVSDFIFSLDMAMPDITFEVVEPEPGKLEIYLDNGCILIEAEDIDIQLCKENPLGSHSHGSRPEFGG